MLIILLLALSRANAAEIVVTITGTLNAGADLLNLFKLGENYAGADFKLVYRFDDSKGKTVDGNTACGKTGNGIIGYNADSPATAVITINGISHEYGKLENPVSKAWRSIASSCSASELQFSFGEGPQWYRSVVNVVLRPARGVRTLTQDVGWSAPVSTTEIEPWSNQSGFTVMQDAMHGTSAGFNVKSLTIIRK
jgi:hypothetical protein